MCDAIETFKQDFSELGEREGERESCALKSNSQLCLLAIFFMYLMMVTTHKGERAKKVKKETEEVCDLSPFTSPKKKRMLTI